MFYEWAITAQSKFLNAKMFLSSFTFYCDNLKWIELVYKLLCNWKLAEKSDLTPKRDLIMSVYGSWLLSFAPKNWRISR